MRPAYPAHRLIPLVNSAFGRWSGQVDLTAGAARVSTWIRALYGATWPHAGSNAYPRPSCSRTASFVCTDTIAAGRRNQSVWRILTMAPILWRLAVCLLVCFIFKWAKAIFSGDLINGDLTAIDLGFSFTSQYAVFQSARFCGSASPLATASRSIGKTAFAEQDRHVARWPTLDRGFAANL